VLQPVQVLQQQPGVIKAACAAALAHEAVVYKEVTNAKVRVCSLHPGAMVVASQHPESSLLGPHRGQDHGDDGHTHSCQLVVCAYVHDCNKLLL
jgi:hypothetical protein